MLSDDSLTSEVSRSASRSRTFALFGSLRSSTKVVDGSPVQVDVRRSITWQIDAEDASALGHEGLPSQLAGRPQERLPLNVSSRGLGTGLVGVAGLQAHVGGRFHYGVGIVVVATELINLVRIQIFQGNLAAATRPFLLSETTAVTQLEAL